MGSSSKKKKEKQKDFQKAKLKVGKSKPKPDNFTDTSFKSKSITLTQQSLTLHAPSETHQFSHHVSLLNSRSDSHRRDSLAHLTTTISCSLSSGSGSLPVPVPTLLPSLLPLILDAQPAIRANVLKLLRVLPPGDIADHIPSILPYLRAGLTHLAPDVRISSLDILDYLLSVAGEEVVSCGGGWVKVLSCLVVLVGWYAPSSGVGSGVGRRVELGKVGREGKGLIRGVVVLGRFLESGLEDHDQDQDQDGIHEEGGFPILSSRIPSSAQPFAYLNLFAPPRDQDSEMYETVEDRRRVFVERFLPAVRVGVERARQEGGELGRASVGVWRVLKLLE